MRLLTILLSGLQILSLPAAEPEIRNLKWFEASGAIESYRSGYKSKVRPRLVLFSSSWDLTSELLRRRIVESLKEQPNNNPILLDADCTDTKDSKYFEILKANGLGRSMPVLGVYTESGWDFIDCNAEEKKNRGVEGFNWIEHLVQTVLEKTRQGEQAVLPKSDRAGG